MSGYSSRDIGVNPNLCNASPETARNLSAIRNVLETIQPDIQAISDVVDSTAGGDYNEFVENFTNILNGVSAGSAKIAYFRISAMGSSPTGQVLFSSDPDLIVGSTIPLRISTDLHRTAVDANGYAVWNGEADAWEVIAVQQLPLYGIATASTYSCSGSGGASISGFIGLSPAPFDLTPDPLPDLAVNLTGHVFGPGDTVFVVYDQAGGDRWLIVDVTKKAIEVVTDIRLGATGIEAKMATIYGYRCGTETDTWTQKIGTAQCTPEEP